MSLERKSIRIGPEEYSLSREDIVAVAARETPRRVNAYFVEINGLRFPPKQLLRGATGTAQPFDTAAAIRVLRALGVEVVSVEVSKPND